MQGGRDLSEELDPLCLIRLLSEMSVVDAKLGSTHEPFLNSHRLCPLLRLLFAPKVPDEESKCDTTPPYQLLDLITSKGVEQSPRILACRASAD